VETPPVDGLKLLFAGLALSGLYFLTRWVQAIRAAHAGDRAPGPLGLTIGFVTNFFDTLGIGSFAPTTSLFKLWKVVPDEEIPGTMHVGHTPPVLVQAFIFIVLVQVEFTTLVSTIAAAVLGAWLGAGVVARLPRKAIQLGMGAALLIAALSFVASNLGWFPAGGSATALEGLNLVIASAGMFVFGALMTLGVGIYAPCMITVSLLGMNPTTAFPIMMGASAFLMPVAALRFIQHERYNLKAALGLAIGGLPAVAIAAGIVKAIPLEYMRWLVVVVVLYAAVQMLRSAQQDSADHTAHHL